MLITSATFVKSAAKLEHCPEDQLPEVTVIGRSNVGKSSLINMLTDKKQLAKSSATPGKTQLINYFLINESRYLVDLPGYGYAKKSKENRAQRMDAMQDYLTQRETLQHTFVLIDGNIPPQEIDLAFLEILNNESIAFSIIITKIDKSNQKTINKNIKELQQYIQNNLTSRPTIFLCSSVKQKGKKELLSFIKNLVE